MLEFGTFVIVLIASVITGGFIVETVQKKKSKYENLLR